MLSLRDRWLRCWLHRYFAALSPMDRATVYIALVLALAAGFSCAAIVKHREPAIGLAPSITAPPFELAFA